MKSQYIGDAGDYGKFGLLRYLSECGCKVGVNWYLTPDDNSTDGRHTQYLSKEGSFPDQDLLCTLSKIVRHNLRGTQYVETEDIIPGAIFYSDSLNFQHIPDRMERANFRKAWHNNGIAKLNDCDIIFLDPDNGLQVKSRSLISKYGNKYVAYDEAIDYYRAGKTVLIYNHRDRTKEPVYLHRFHKFLAYDDIDSNNILCLTFHPYSVRDYLFLIQPSKAAFIKSAISEMLKTQWGTKKYFTLRPLNFSDCT